MSLKGFLDPWEMLSLLDTWVLAHPGPLVNTDTPKKQRSLTG